MATSSKKVRGRSQRVGFPPRPLCITPSTFPNTICFSNCPPLNRVSAPAYESLLVRKFVVSILSHPVISKARSSGGLASSAASRWCKARHGGVRCDGWSRVPGEASSYCIHIVGPRLPRPSPFGAFGWSYNPPIDRLMLIQRTQVHLTISVNMPGILVTPPTGR